MTAEETEKSESSIRLFGWRGRWEGGSGRGIHVYPWLIHVNVWQKALQYCKVISLQLIKKIKSLKKKWTGGQFYFENLHYLNQGKKMILQMNFKFAC